MKRTIIGVACVLLAGNARAQSLGEKTGVNSALGVAPATADFVKEVAISDTFEIESSNLAEQKGDAQAKRFAQQMVTDHTKTRGELEGLVGGGKVQATLPTALDSSHQSKLDKLKNAAGKDFSSDYDSYRSPPPSVDSTACISGTSRCDLQYSSTRSAFRSSARVSTTVLLRLPE